MKRMAALICIIPIICSVISVYTSLDIAVKAQAIEDSTLSGQCGDSMFWSMDPDSGTLTLSGSGIGYTYYYPEPDVQLDQPWTEWKDAIRRIVVEEGITSVGNGLIADHPAVTEVILPESITDCGCDLYSNVWEHMPALESISIPEGNTEYRTIDGILFSRSSGCILKYPTAKKDSVYEVPADITEIYHYAFTGNTNITSVKFLGDVTTIGYEAFMGCTGLQSVDLPESLTIINSYAFQDCVNLEAVSIPESIDDIYGVFQNCKKLKNVYIPAHVSEMESAFTGCSGLQAIEVDPQNTTYQSIDGVVFSKDNKTLVQYPGGREGSYAVPMGTEEIGDSAFEGSCLSQIQLPDSITNIGYEAFQGCSGLTEIVIPQNTASVGTYFLCDCENLRSVTFLGSECKIPSESATICNRYDGYDYSELAGGYTASSYSGTLSGPLSSTAQSYALEQGYPFYVLGTDEPFDPYKGKPVIYKRSSDSLEVTDDGEHLRCTIYNDIIQDIDPEQEIGKKITVNFHVSGIGTDSVDLSENGTGMPLAVYLCGWVGGEMYYNDDYENGTFPDEQVAMIHGDGDYSVTWYVEEETYGIYALYLDSNIDVFHYGAVMTPDYLYTGCTAAITIDSIHIDGYDAPDGDINFDGSLSVSDVVLLQKWLLAVPNKHLPNWRAGDLCEDNKLNAFDLCMMKRMLLSK